MKRDTEPSSEDFELDMIRSICEELKGNQVAEKVNLIEEEIDIAELPESEQEAIWQRADEKFAGLAHLSPEELEQKIREEALELARVRGLISTCTLQRYLYIGYGRAAKIIDEMLEAGRLKPSDKGGRVYEFVK